ncbi:hypothetical protein FIBSPDRAFT_927253 [Athelia psychrophila]|uniref:2-dehydropantoate 2-reductase n=1 Tax=Athelia psychrophila TaxID=1759441 RepID=A0A166RYX7_9AGAM|nr:hypothetical protein FIBSPDRAFT_927253 [Fibularhizoctonia sp. CBS 109695]
MRFHIIGVGAIGSLVAHHLRSVLPSGHKITLIVKNKRFATRQPDAVRVEHNGIVTTTSGFDAEVFDRDEELRARTPPKRKWALDMGYVPEEPQAPSALGPIESLIVTTKSHSTLAAIKRLVPRLSAESTIVLLQNGMGIYEQLCQDIFRSPETRPQFILAANTHGAWVKNFDQVVHAGVGDISFGIVPDPRGRDFEAALKDESVHPRERRLRIDDISTREEAVSPSYQSLRLTVAALSALEPLDSKWAPISDVQLAMRRKVVVNSIVNPLTALMGCRNGDLFRDKASLRIARRVCRESSAAFEAEMKAGAQTMLEELNDPEDDGQAPLGRLPRGLEAQFLIEETTRVARMTGGNVSSMLADVRKGQLSEIDNLNGYLGRLGTMHNVKMPYTLMLADLIRMRHSIPFDQL